MLHANPLALFWLLRPRCVSIASIRDFVRVAIVAIYLSLANRKLTKVTNNNGLLNKRVDYAHSTTTSLLVK